MTISIHAPAKGATLTMTTRRTTLAYFNPRTREGCDQSVSGRRTGCSDFNPRTREGCDTNDLFVLQRGSSISIHAPAKGATINKMVRLINAYKFQSTHPRRVRRCRRNQSQRRGRYFNPRTRAGCDLQVRTCAIAVWCISIHAPVLGATLRSRRRS